MEDTFGLHAASEALRWEELSSALSETARTFQGREFGTLEEEDLMSQPLLPKWAATFLVLPRAYDIGLGRAFQAPTLWAFPWK